MAGNNKVTVAMCYGQFHGPTVRSLTAMVQYDMTRGGRHLDHPDSFIYVGTTMLYQPIVTGASGRPTGQAGWIMYWRFGSGGQVQDAFRLLKL